MVRHEVVLLPAVGREGGEVGGGVDIACRWKVR